MKLSRRNGRLYRYLFGDGEKSLDKIKKLWKFLTSPEMIFYIIFGVLTTIVNIAVFALLNSVLHWDWSVSNLLAWVIGVIFAFLTNKLFVFKSKSWEIKLVLREAASFTAARLLSLGVDMLGMWLLIDCWHANSLLSKVIMNVIVVIINYVFSKLIIFKKK